MLHRPLALVGLALVATGCALFGFGPRPMLARANAAFDRADAEAAYAAAKEIRLQHPDSAESREAFPLAAYAWKVLYGRSRHVDSDAAWVTTEPAFLFDWLASASGRESPEALANVLFVGVDRGIFRQFEAFAAARPELSAWRLHAEDDNGIVGSVTAERSEARAP